MTHSQTVEKSQNYACHRVPVLRLVHPRVASLVLRTIHLLAISEIEENILDNHLKMFENLGDCQASVRTGSQ